MTYHYYYTLLGEYLKIKDKERFLGEIGYPADLDLDPEQLVKAVDIIAAAAECDIKQLVTISGLSMAAFARAYGMPYRTLQDWCLSNCIPADYIPHMIGYAMIGDMQ